MKHIFMFASIAISTISFSTYCNDFEEAYGPLRVIENEAFYLPKIPVLDRTEMVDIDKNLTTYIDVKGVGDSAWAQGASPANANKTPIKAGFLKAMENIDPQKMIFKGDISFINWESAVGEYCNHKRGSVDWFFLSHPDNINQAHEAGFNLFGLSNNHSQDCQNGTSSIKLKSPVVHGPLMTAESMKRKSKELEILWHGTGSNPYNVRTREITIDKAYSGYSPLMSPKVKVAFASLGIMSWEIPNAANIRATDSEYGKRVTDIMNAFDSSGAQIKILSLHTQDRSGHGRYEREAFLKLKKIAELFIKEHDGTIVYGQGPHTFGGVKVLVKEKFNYKKGVIFTSMGNFIHQGLGPNVDNYMGRALVDPYTYSVKGVQVVPFTNRKTYVDYYTSDTYENNSILSNFKWSYDSIYDSGKVISTYFANFN